MVFTEFSQNPLDILREYEGINHRFEKRRSEMNFKKLATVAGISLSLVASSAVAAQAGSHQTKGKAETNQTAVSKYQAARSAYQVASDAAKVAPSKKATREVAKKYGKAIAAYKHAKQVIAKNFSAAIKKAKSDYKAATKGKTNQADVVASATATRDAAIASATAARDADRTLLGAAPVKPVKPAKK